MLLIFIPWRKGACGEVKWKPEGDPRHGSEDVFASGGGSSLEDRALLFGLPAGGVFHLLPWLEAVCWPQALGKTAGSLLVTQTRTVNWHVEGHSERAVRVASPPGLNRRPLVFRA